MVYKNKLLHVQEALRRFGGANAASEIKSLAYSGYGKKSQHILDLSFESGASVLTLARDILDFDAARIIKIKKGIKSSVNIAVSTATY